MDHLEGRHRANYILEQGTWRATCQVCGHYVKDPLRRRAASLFRAHIRDTAQVIDLRSKAEVIDLYSEAEVIDLRPAERTAQIRI
jgi:hypothetical protein